MPEANAPDPATTGQGPATSEKMQPKMDSVGRPKSPAGAERKQRLSARSGINWARIVANVWLKRPNGALMVHRAAKGRHSNVQ